MKVILYQNDEINWRMNYTRLKTRSRCSL